MSTAMIAAVQSRFQTFSGIFVLRFMAGTANQAGTLARIRAISAA